MTNDELQEWLRQKFQMAYVSGRAGNRYSAIEAAASVIHDLKLVWQDNSLPATKQEGADAQAKYGVKEE